MSLILTEYCHFLQFFSQSVSGPLRKLSGPEVLCGSLESGISFLYLFKTAKTVAIIIIYILWIFFLICTICELYLSVCDPILSQCTSIFLKKKLYLLQKKPMFLGIWNKQLTLMTEVFQTSSLLYRITSLSCSLFRLDASWTQYIFSKYFL